MAKLPVEGGHTNHASSKPSKKSPNGTGSGNQDDSVEVWKLRCKFLAEKYFNTLKDMKKDLDELKYQAIKEVR